MTRMTIFLENTDIGDLFVSVWDLNQAHSPLILKEKRIVKDERLPLDVEVDGDHYFSIRWYAQRTDDAETNKTVDVRENNDETVDISTYMS